MTNNKSQQIILASKSPSRKKLLEQIGILDFTIVPADVEEVRQKGEKPQDMAKRLSAAKCHKISQENPDAIVISADTVSVVGGRVLDKTYDEEIEREYLELIGGRRHRLYTSFCVAHKNKNIFVQKTVMSTLQFKRFSEEEINEYINSKEWQGCSGGYAIEGLAAKYLKNITGSFSNILGLPLFELSQVLKGVGVVNK